MLREIILLLLQFDAAFQDCFAAGGCIVSTPIVMRNLCYFKILPLKSADGFSIVLPSQTSKLYSLQYCRLQMNILIIYSHPSRKSYTFSILEQLKKEFTEQNWNIEVSDLYALNFQTDMTEKEYEREGFAKFELPISDDVQDEHKKLEWADCVIFLYPVWWSGSPAKLKGWFDRVYSVGYAYKQTDNFPIMKTFNLGFVICTAGYSNDLLNETGMAQSMEAIMLDDRLGSRFKHKEMLILGGTLDMEKVRCQHKQQITDLIATIKTYCA